jgi:hypothetical protein
MSVILWIFKEGANSGGPPDSSNRRRTRLNVSLRRDQELATPGKAQTITWVKPEGFGAQRGERGTETRALVDRVSGSRLS